VLTVPLVHRLITVVQVLVDQVAPLLVLEMEIWAPRVVYMAVVVADVCHNSVLGQQVSAALVQ
jgi:hypothetical protein